jgi:hypothetical protein
MPLGLGQKAEYRSIKDMVRISLLTMAVERLQSVVANALARPTGSHRESRQSWSLAPPFRLSSQPQFLHQSQTTNIEMFSSNLVISHVVRFARSSTAHLFTHSCPFSARLSQEKPLGLELDFSSHRTLGLSAQRVHTVGSRPDLSCSRGPIRCT